MKTTFWDWVIKTFYVIPGHPELDAEHSVVMTLDSRAKIYPHTRRKQHSNTGASYMVGDLYSAMGHSSFLHYES